VIQSSEQLSYYDTDLLQLHVHATCCSPQTARAAKRARAAPQRAAMLNTRAAATAEAPAHSRAAAAAVWAAAVAQVAAEQAAAEAAAAALLPPQPEPSTFADLRRAAEQAQQQAVMSGDVPVRRCGSGLFAHPAGEVSQHS
jgi:hypothetical protein